MDESWAEGVVLPNLVLEHLSASVLRNQDKKRMRKDEKLIEIKSQIENQIMVH